MRRAILIVALLAFASDAHALDLAKMIQTIVLVENSNRPGKAGEQGPLQFLPSVWRQYSKTHISWASSRRPECVAEQHRVARVHIAWIRAQLKAIGLAPDEPYNIALVWTAGFDTVRLGKTSEAKRDYAGRAHNIYGSLR